eukprot:3223149-Heterocapsa_arctica.AAC.1
MLQWLCEQANIPSHAFRDHKFTQGSDKEKEKATLYFRDPGSKRKLHNYLEQNGGGSFGTGLEYF